MPNDSAFDPENPEWTREEFVRAQPGSALPANMLAALPRTRRRDIGARIAASHPSALAILAQGKGARLAILGA